MGYRSKVVMAIRKSEQTQFAIDAFTTASWSYSGELYFVRREMNDDIVLFISDGYSIKWYENYPEEYPVVFKLCDVMRTLNDNDLEEMFQFVRFGEEFDDTEFDGCLDVLNAYRKIEYWYDTEQAMEEL